MKLKTTRAILWKKTNLLANQILQFIKNITARKKNPTTYVDNLLTLQGIITVDNMFKVLLCQAPFYALCIY